MVFWRKGWFHLFPVTESMTTSKFKNLNKDILKSFENNWDLNERSKIGHVFLMDALVSSSHVTALLTCSTISNCWTWIRHLFTCLSHMKGKTPVTASDCLTNAPSILLCYRTLTSLSAPTMMLSKWYNRKWRRKPSTMSFALLNRFQNW